MARKSLKTKLRFKTYEQQAQWSIVLAGIGALSAVAAAGIVWRNFDSQNFLATYSPETLYLPAMGSALFVALATSTVGFFVAFNSAGQRRNKKSRLSWTAFFVNAGVIALAFSIAVLFVFARNPIKPAP